MVLIYQRPFVPNAALAPARSCSGRLPRRGKWCECVKQQVCVQRITLHPNR